MLTLPAGQVYQLQRIQALEDSKSEILKWAKGRFWIITVVVVVVSSFGGYTLIKSTVRDLLDREIDAAKREMLTASHDARSAGTAAAQIIKQAENYASTVDGLTNKAQGIEFQLAALQQKIQAETANARALSTQEVKGISARLATLEQLVTTLARESKDNALLVSKYQSELSLLRSKAAAVSQRFAENGNYNVVVSFSPRAEKLSDQITVRFHFRDPPDFKLGDH